MAVLQTAREQPTGEKHNCHGQEVQGGQPVWLPWTVLHLVLPQKTVAMTTVVRAPVGRTTLLQGSVLQGAKRAHAEQ